MVDDDFAKFIKNEKKFDPSERGSDKSTFYEVFAMFIIDNNLNVDEILSKYSNIAKFIEKSELQKEIKSYEDYKKEEERYEHIQSLNAWAEEEMDKMGFNYEDD